MTSLYIHIPFCKSRCFYCSFASFEKKDGLIRPYLEALKKEASLYKGEVIGTVYIGGGTPSYLSPGQLTSLFGILRANFNVPSGAEVTLEANPATFGLEKARQFFSEGINRVSLGVQSLSDKYLKWLGRPHSSQEAVVSFEILRKAGFDNISVDLIYSLPSQSKREIEHDVRALAGLQSEHISAYSLTVSEGSEFGARKTGCVAAERQAEHYASVAALLEGLGFCHYEVSNFAKRGFLCRHNLNYWQGGDYIGLGTAAHSHRDNRRFWNTPDIGSYIELMDKEGAAKIGEECLSAPERLMETLLIGLRMTGGVDVRKTETSLQTKLPPEKAEAIEGFVRQGLLTKEGAYLKPTLSGMMVLDELCSHLI